uniref:Cytochrome c biogenesis protein CcsA n=1 Tax=Ruppia brevipedunculata TaxID=2027461 RepID=A0A7G7YGI2_9LILI|nr:cytochrome c heme attachment protein [Ruppia brevipedunculata]QNH93602.1 cytochrome c heme attachment protein [Ruppia brevipedunculata]
MIFVTLEHILTHISFSIISIVIMIHLMTLLAQEIVGLEDSLEKGMVVTFLFITGFLVIHWISSGHFPLSNLHESLMFLSWSFFIIHMIPYFRNPKKKTYLNLNTITAPSAIFIQGFATSGLSTETYKSAILVPALQSQWLMMHVSMMLLSYAALLFGSLFSIALLVITFRKSISKNKNSLIRSFFFSETYLNDKKKFFQNPPFLSFGNYYKYQLIQRLDYWSYRIISLGFTFLTIGILSGAVWANEAWGSYWNWDPKETWAFITWTIYAIYLHTRTNKNFQGMNSAIVASMGFLIIWICYFGVNLLGIGLHSYGAFPFLSN